MHYADAIRRQAEDAPRAALPAVTAALWRAFAEGHVTEAEAEALSGLIELRQASARRRGENAAAVGISNLGATQVLRSPVLGSADRAGVHTDGHAPQDRQRSPKTGVGSRPRSDASLERRRRWAASGRLPPALAARFTLAEQAVLSLIAAEAARRGDCRLSVGQLAAVAGVAERTVQNAIREARKLGLLTVEERRLTGFRNDTNVVRIVSPEWQSWLRLARREDRPARRGALAISRKGGGCKFPHWTPTQVLEQGKTRSRYVPKCGIAVPISPSQAMSRKAGA